MGIIIIVQWYYYYINIVYYLIILYYSVCCNSYFKCINEILEELRIYDGFLQLYFSSYRTIIISRGRIFMHYYFIKQ